MDWNVVKKKPRSSTEILTITTELKRFMDRKDGDKAIESDANNREKLLI